MSTEEEVKRSKLKNRFLLAKLPYLELYFYYGIWIAHSLGAFLLVIKISYQLKRTLQPWLPRSEYLSNYRIDTTDVEWSFYRDALPQILLVNICHSCVFYIIPKLFTKRTSQYILIAFWFLAQLYLTSVKCMCTFMIIAIIVVLIASFTRNEFIVWALCIAFIMKANVYAPYSRESRIYYREFNFYLYGAIKILNFCIYLIRNNKSAICENALIRYAQYLLYPPYTSMLIVVYEDFNAQISRVEDQQQNFHKQPLSSILTKELLWRLLRLVVWYFAFEFILHFNYVHSLFNIPFQTFRLFSNYELAATAYVHGQFFYWKYVLIFGIPSWFALLDQMKPPDAPICISRVSRYSRMWRYFDRGLYQFLKLQVYIPIMGDMEGNMARLRRFIAMIGAFLFVLAWHGTSANYIYWVSLSASELIIERIGYSIANTFLWNQLSEKIGKLNQRRLIAFAMLTTVIPGIFGVFFFLGRDGFGQLIFKRLLIDGFIDVVHLRISLKQMTPSAGFVFLHFIALGYCFNHICLELDETIQHEQQQQQDNSKQSSSNGKKIE